MADGRLWFATTHGVIVIDPRQLQRKLPAPPALIEEVIVNGRPEQAEQLGSLPPGQENLEFRYTGLSFLFPGRITFHYKLEGFDKEWIDAGSRREAFYTNLPPGSFRFRVAAANLDGVFSDTPSVVSFTLAPHLYQRRWFWPGCVALAAWRGLGGNSPAHCKA